MGGAGTARFSATIDDEDRKVNAQLDGSATSGLLAGQLASFMALVADRKWDPLFEREDANGVKQSRNELAADLKDWVDEDPQQSAVTGVPSRPFENGFGDENYLYDRGPDRYKAKNARFDSLEELYLVAGFSDLHMAAFGDRLTVYQRRDWDDERQRRRPGRAGPQRPHHGRPAGAAGVLGSDLRGTAGRGGEGWSASAASSP